MNKLATAEPRAVPFKAVRYDAFRITERATYSLGTADANTLDEALNFTLANSVLLHKEHLVIRETGERGAKLHLYAIKRKSAPNYVYRDYAYHREYRLYAACVCTIDENRLNESTRDGSGDRKPLPVNE